MSFEAASYCLSLNPMLITIRYVLSFLLECLSFSENFRTKSSRLHYNTLRFMFRIISTNLPLENSCISNTGIPGMRIVCSFVFLFCYIDVKGPPTHRLSCGQSPYTETTSWERKYCILTDSQLVLLNKEKEVRCKATIHF